MKALALDFDGVHLGQRPRGLRRRPAQLRLAAAGVASRAAGAAVGAEAQPALFAAFVRPHAPRQPRGGLRRRPRGPRGRRRAAGPGRLRRLLREPGGRPASAPSTSASTRCAPTGPARDPEGWLRAAGALSRPSSRCCAAAPARRALRDRHRQGPRARSCAAARRLRRRRTSSTRASILDKETGVSKRAHLRASGRAAWALPFEEITFVDDKVNHLRGRGRRSGCAARWPPGATTAPASAAEAREAGFLVCTLEDAEARLFGPPSPAGNAALTSPGHVTRTRLPDARGAHAQPEQHQVGAGGADRARGHRCELPGAACAAEVSPLAAKLFAVKGVTGVFFAPGFVTVSKTEGRRLDGAGRAPRRDDQGLRGLGRGRPRARLRRPAPLRPRATSWSASAASSRTRCGRRSRWTAATWSSRATATASWRSTSRAPARAARAPRRRSASASSSACGRWSRRCRKSCPSRRSGSSALGRPPARADEQDRPARAAPGGECWVDARGETLRNGPFEEVAYCGRGAAPPATHDAARAPDRRAARARRGRGALVDRSGPGRARGRRALARAAGGAAPRPGRGPAAGAALGAGGRGRAPARLPRVVPRRARERRLAAAAGRARARGSGNRCRRPPTAPTS